MQRCIDVSHKAGAYDTDYKKNVNYGGEKDHSRSPGGFALRAFLKLCRGQPRNVPRRSDFQPRRRVLRNSAGASLDGRDATRMGQLLVLAAISPTLENEHRYMQAQGIDQKRYQERISGDASLTHRELHRLRII